MLFASADGALQIPQATLTEPSHMDRMKDEQELLGFTVSGHPLDLFPSIAWEKYCPILKDIYFSRSIVGTYRLLRGIGFLL